jgi:RND superfamily putative drug exporter
MTEGLANLLFRRKTLVSVLIALWVTTAVIFGAAVPGKLSSSSSNFQDTASESSKAADQLRAASGASPEAGVIALVQIPEGIDSPKSARHINEVARKLSQDPAVGQVVSYYDTGDKSFVSKDNKSTFVAVFMKEVGDAARLQTLFADDPEVKLGGELIASEQISKQVEKDLLRAELIAFPILFILSFFIFRGLVAAILPVVCGGFAIISTFFFLNLVNHYTPLSIYAINLVTGLSLGLAIDYSLFMVSRFREELGNSNDVQKALLRTLNTSGRTVLFSSLTVAAVLASLLLFPQPFLYSMGIGGLIAALMSGFTALVILSGIIALLGKKINALAPARMQVSLEGNIAAEHKGSWYRFSHFVMRHAAVVAISSAAFLLLLGAPFLGVKFTGINASVLPTTASARQVSDKISRDFQAEFSSPIYVSLVAPKSSQDAVKDYSQKLKTLPGAGAVGTPRPVGKDLWRLDVYSAKPSLDETTKNLVKEIRRQPAPGPVMVGGSTAAFLDQQSSLKKHLPKMIVAIVLSTLILLLVVTRSIILPIKSLLMNALTLSATFGILVYIFQEGHFQRLLDYSSQGALETTQPILLAVVAFALSTDYTIFLLARIKEIHDEGESNTESVARGVERTGRLITLAALLFCVAVAVFSTSKIVFIKELGLGMALAVLIDAIIVRALLVPSLMKLLGRRNWWAPKFLK